MLLLAFFRCPSDRLKGGVGVVQKEKRERKESLRAAARRWRSAHPSSAGSAAQQSFKGPGPGSIACPSGFASASPRPNSDLDADLPPNLLIAPRNARAFPYLHATISLLSSSQP